MDRDRQKQDIVRVLDFTEKLLEFLLTLVPPHRAHDYTTVWESEVRSKLHWVRSEVQQLTDASPQWSRLDDVGWSPEQAHVKTETLAEEAGKGALATTIRLTNAALGSLKLVFFGLEPPKELKDFLETWAENRPEPEPYIQTLFGPGPIPGPPKPPPVAKPGRRFR